MLKSSLLSKYLNSTLDPSYINYTHEFFLLENLTARLVNLDEHGDYQLSLASEIQKISPTSFRIRIKESCFSNGEKISIKDVKNTYERVIKLGSSHANLKSIIESIKEDGDTLTINLKERNNSFLFYLSLPDLGILHRTQLDEKLTSQSFTQISSGPFIYKSENGEDFSLVKNPHFKLSGIQYPDRVELIVPYSKDDLKECSEGKQAIGVIPTERIKEAKELIKKNNNLKIMGHPSDFLNYLVFNQHSNLFKETNHRKWFIHQVNKYFFVPTEYDGLAVKSNQYFHPLSRAFIEPSKLKSMSLKKIEKPRDFPKEVIIKINPERLNMTFKRLVEALKNIPEVKITLQLDNRYSFSDNDKKEKNFDLYFYLMSTDYRIPVEAINIEYFSNAPNLTDSTGEIKKSFLSYQSAESEEIAHFHLTNIAKRMLADEQFIPLFHSVNPYLVNTDLVDIGDANHLFIHNYWKFKAK